MKRILKLRHSVHPTHVERWFLQEDGNILVKSECPGNSPSNTEGVFTPVQALRNYALLTSPLEGWEVDEDTGWHSAIDALEV